jgi:hypothetical protein
LVSAFDRMLLELSPAFTQPTRKTFHQLAYGWVLTPGVGTVTGMIRTLGAWATKHWTVYEKFFYRASWSLEQVSQLLLTRLIGPGLKGVVDLNIDDTTCARRGKHVAFAGWFKDASACAQKEVIHWAHNWILSAVTLRMPQLPDHRLALPVQAVLYRKREDCSRDEPFVTRHQVAARMVHQVAEALPGIRIRLAVDGQYATRDLLGDLPANAWAVTRLRKDAALHALPGIARQGRRGRKPKKGKRLPTPEHLAQRDGPWQKVDILKQGRSVNRRVFGMTCLWPHVCKTQPVRVLIFRDPTGQEPDDYAICTDPTVPDAEAAQRFYDRWGIEEAIEESKQCLGMERTQGWCPRTVLRQAPMAMIFTSLIKLWYVLHAVDVPELRPVRMPWYGHKRSTSFRDMLSAFRRVLWMHRNSANSPSGGKFSNFVRALIDALCSAA